MKTLPYLTTTEAAEYIGVSADHMRRLIRKGEVVSVNVSTRIDGRPSWRVSVASLQKFIGDRERVGRVNDDKVRAWRRGA